VADEKDGREGQDGLEGQDRQDRREADAEIQDGESLPKRGAAELKSILEALIFASPDPMTVKAMCKLLDAEPKEDVIAALAGLKDDYEQRPGGLQLVEVAGGYQIVTRSDLHEWVRRLFHERTTQKLTVQGLETLAVIAYAFSFYQKFLWLAFKIGGVTFGSLLGVFLLGFLTDRKSNKANILGMVTMAVINAALLVLSEMGIFPIAWTWLLLIGTAGTFTLGYFLGPRME